MQSTSFNPVLDSEIEQEVIAKNISSSILTTGCNDPFFCGLFLNIQAQIFLDSIFDFQS